jgi:hypothetical protein
MLRAPRGRMWSDASHRKELHLHVRDHKLGKSVLLVAVAVHLRRGDESRVWVHKRSKWLYALQPMNNHRKFRRHTSGVPRAIR